MIAISIVTPSLNQGDFIEETIRSVLSQEGDFFLDYLVMDGGSRDRSLPIIRRYEELLRVKKWPVRCGGISYRWQSGADRGQADAINKGFALARGSIFGWLNSDDIYTPGALAAIAGLDWGRAGLCYGRGTWISRDGRILCDYPTFRPNRYSLLVKCTLCQPAVFISRPAWLRLGPLSEEFYCVFDYDYWLRAVFEREKFLFVDRSLAGSRMYRQNKSLSAPGRAAGEAESLIACRFAAKPLFRPLLWWYRQLVGRVTTRREKAMLMHLEETETR